jgi:hypothetical protein
MCSLRYVRRELRRALQLPHKQHGAAARGLQALFAEARFGVQAFIASEPGIECIFFGNAKD